MDLFCGAGGASIGLNRAGFKVVGVDTADQKTYPFEFHKHDAMTFPLEGFDLVWASPPCQAYSKHVSSSSSQWAGTLGRNEPRLIQQLRIRLQESGIPFVIENVTGAKEELKANLTLCGTMFGLPITRHRLFETNFPIPQPVHKSCRGVSKAFAAVRGWNYRDMSVTGKGRNAGTKDRWMEIMGWPVEVPVTQHGLRESIPPAYSEYIGKEFLN